MEANTSWCEKRENVQERITFCFGFISCWLTKWRECFFFFFCSFLFLNQSLSAVILPDRSKRELLCGHSRENRSKRASNIFFSFTFLPVRWEGGVRKFQAVLWRHLAGVQESWHCCPVQGNSCLVYTSVFWKKYSNVYKMQQDMWKFICASL